MNFFLNDILRWNYIYIYIYIYISGLSVRSGNYCFSSIRVASKDENKNSHRKITMTHTQTTIRDVALKSCQKR